MYSVKIYQIYYNEETRNMVNPLFIPLDNTDSPNNDWFEFWPIKNFLDHNELEENTFYGFFSPRFEQKARMPAAALISLIQEKAQEVDVFLSTFGFNAISYYQNLFEQGERAHPGITDLSQKVFDKLGMCVDLKKLVSSVHNIAFSNYIVGNKEYWQEWKYFADRFYDLVESDQTELGHALRGKTGYFRGETAMRTFIQERAPSVLLASGKYRTYAFGPEWDSSRKESLSKHEMCNYFKNRYIETGDPMDFAVYRHIRSLLPKGQELGWSVPAPVKYHPLVRKLENKVFKFSHVDNRFPRTIKLLPEGRIENIGSDGHSNEVYWDVDNDELILKNGHGKPTSRYFLLIEEKGMLFAQGYFIANRKIQFKLTEISSEI